jgi:hypothetical protein
MERIFVDGDETLNHNVDIKIYFVQQFSKNKNIWVFSLLANNKIKSLKKLLLFQNETAASGFIIAQLKAFLITFYPRNTSLSLSVPTVSFLLIFSLLGFYLTLKVRCFYSLFGDGLHDISEFIDGAPNSTELFYG